MAVTQGSFLVVFLLIFPGFVLNICPEPCTCQLDSLWNCSSAGLTSAPQHLNNSIKELDLSNNRLGFFTLRSKYYNLQKVWLGNNSITHLYLCVDPDVGLKSVNRLRRGLRPSREWGCTLWAPTLQLLSAERNYLEKLPEGLGQQRSLQILQLSFNKISTLNPKDFSHLEQLKELHLQHNLITSLDPQMFQKLDKLKVVDLSFNMLTSLHPLTYVSLRNIGATVGLRGNRWTCDCKMRFLRRSMAYDSSRGLTTWSLECAFPSGHSGRDLLQVNEDDLECHNSDTNPEIHQDVTVYSGSDLLLTCVEQDATWWIPNDQVSRSQQQTGLFLSKVTEQDAGLYVCVSESQNKVVSIYNVQIRDTRKRQTRNTRSLPNQQINSFTRMAQPRNSVTQSHFAMAVSLSVIITFLIAFILGVLARPCICALWRKAKKKKSSSEAYSVSSEQQTQYNNEAYEDQEEMEPHRERRVTFSTIEYSEEGNVQYYDTVAADVRGGNAAVTGRGPNQESSDDSRSEHSSSEDQKHTKKHIEHIPDSIEEGERNSLSSHSSHSSTADILLRENCSTPNTTQAFEDHLQKTAIVPQISIESTNEIPGFTSEPFADWSPHLNNSSLMSPELDNGEQFEFSDSVRSTSPRSPSSLNESFERPILLVPSSNKKVRFSSSSSSDVSDDEPTHYTVNPDSDEEHVETEVSHKVVTNSNISQDIGAPSSSSSSDNESESLHAESQWPVLDLEHLSSVKRRLDVKIISADSYSSEIIIGKNEMQAPELFLPAIDQKPLQMKKRRAPPPPRKSSSSSDSEDEREKGLKHTQIIKQDSKTVHFEESHWPVIDLQRFGKVKRRLDIKVQRPFESSSSSDSEDEREIQPIKLYQENPQLATSPNKESTTVRFDQEAQWPTVKLEGAGKVKRRLDIKVLAPESDTSSSDSEDERTYQEVKPPFLKQESITVRHEDKLLLTPTHLDKVTAEKSHVDIKPPKPEYYTSSSSESDDETQGFTEKHDQKTNWPVLNLDKTRKIKRRLDFKVRAPPPELSFIISDREDEHKIKEVKQNQQQATSSNKQTTTVISSEESQWPAIDLIKVHKVKRRLDIKATLPPDEMSFSSDSENEKVNLKVTQVPEKIPKPKSHTSSSSESEDETPRYTEKHDLKTNWPVLDLEYTRKINRRLDVKVRSPPTELLSSSDSEDEREIKVEKHYQENLQQATSPVKQPIGVHFDQEESHWPALDLTKVPKVKRRLDIKTNLPSAESSSSSDSEDGKVNLKVTQVQERIPKPKYDISSSSESEDDTPLYTEQHDLKTNWPVLDLAYTRKIKRRLDVKVRSPPPELSSSSDSEDEREIKVEKHYQENLQQATSPNKQTTTVKFDEESQWPALDLTKVPKVKQRLNIKTNLPSAESSSSSDSEDGKVNQVQERIPKPKSNTSSSSESEDETPRYTEKHDLKTKWPVLDLEYTRKIKRRLDIKVRSPPPELSSSSDSEDERQIEVEKHYQENLQQATSPVKQPIGVQLDQESQWPVIDLVKIPKVKRRLDIKAPLPSAESPSSSDSEDEKVNLKVTQVQERLPSANINVPKPKSDTSSSSESEDETPRYTEKHDLKTKWPVLDLEYTRKIKRRLDVKVRSPPPEISSSSDSEDEREIKVEKHYQENLQQATSPNKQTTTVKFDEESQWPALDLTKVPKVKRRLDIKTNLPSAESSSSSDSEDEKVNLKVTQVQERIPKPKYDTSSSSESEDETPRYTEKHDLKTNWPVLDLKYSNKIKRRLDVKVRPSPSELSSSSDSEDGREIKVEKHYQENLQQATSPVKQPIVHFDQEESQWPVIDLVTIPKVKQRLDIKATLPHTESLSSSDSEDGKVKVTHLQGRVPSANIKAPKPHDTSFSSESEDETHHYTEKQWPVLDFELTKKVKRRLDVKVRSPPAESSSSSDSEDETRHYTNKLEQVKVDVERTPIRATQIEMTSNEHDEQWPVINLNQIAHIKRRLDFKAPSQPTETSSTRDSGDETVHKEGMTGLGSQGGSNEHWPIVDLGGVARLRRRLDFKTPSPPAEPLGSGSSHTSEIKVKESMSSSSSDEEEEVVTKLNTPVSTAPTSQWPDLGITSSGVPRITRRLDIKGPSLKPEPVSSTSLGSRHSESSSSSEDENEKDLGIGASGKPTHSKIFIRVPKSPSFPRSPTTTPNITLAKYTVVTDEGKSTSGNSTTPEITPELQSKWAAMNLGVSRFRKRLDIMARTNEPPPLPSSSPPDSPTSHRAISLKQDPLTTGTQYTTSVKVSSSSSDSESEQGGVDFEGSAVEIDSAWPQISLTNIPQVKRSLNIAATLQRESSSSSSSEEEPLELTVPDLSAGVPRIKRRLNFKAPTPPPSSASSSSEDESRYAHKFSDVTDQYSIEYRRTIMKTSPNDYYTASSVKSQWQMYSEPQTVESGVHTPRKIPRLKFDNIKRKFLHSKQTLDGELPPNLRWTSVGSHLSEVPVLTLKRHHDGHLSPTPTSPPVLKDVSSDYSGSESEEEVQEVKTTVIVKHKYSSPSPGSVTFSSDKALLGSYESPLSNSESLSATSEDKKERRGLSALKAMSSERRHWESVYENVNETPPVSVDYAPQVPTVYRRSVDVKPQTYTSSASSDERRLADMLYGIPNYRRHIIKTTELPQGPPPPVPSTLPPDETTELTWRSREELPEDQPYYDSPNISAV